MLNILKSPFPPRSKTAFIFYVAEKLVKLPGLGNRSFALRSFALFKKSAKEHFALSLFSKRAKRSDSLFRSLPKERKEQLALLLFTKRATTSKLLFRSFKKSDKEQITLELFTKRATKSESLFFYFFALFKE